MNTTAASELTTEDLLHSILVALHRGHLDAAGCLLNLLRQSNPVAAQHVTDALEQTDARLRAKRGALEAKDWADYRAEMDRDYWEGSEQ